MSVTIRLSRGGRKKAPAFKIIVTNTRNKRDGKYLDVIGHYNPSHNPATFSLDEEKYTEWVSKGALVSDAVKELKEGTYVFKPYNPNAKEEEAKPTEKTDNASEAKEETAENSETEETSEE